MRASTAPIVAAAAALAAGQARAAAATWSNWNHLQTCRPARFLQPSSEQEVVDAVTEAAAQGLAIKTAGAGHSFSAIALTDGLMLQLDRLDKPLRVIAPQGWEQGSQSRPASGPAAVEVQAGMRVHSLNAYLASLGLALPNTGAIAEQSIAGATSTSTHGTGRELGSMATGIAGLRIVLPNGTAVDAGPSNRADLFRVARVGLGALGVVVRVTVKAVPLFKLRRTATPYSLAALMPWVYPAAYNRWPRMQWYYTPRTDEATLLLREPVPFSTPTVDCWNASRARWVDPFRGLRGGESVPVAAGRGAVATPEGLGPAPAAAGLSRPWEGGRPGDGPSPTGPSVECVDLSFRALAHEADDYDLYEEMEMFVEANRSAALADRFAAFENATGLPPRGGPQWAPYSLFTGMRYVAADDIPLSMMHGRDTAVLSFIALGNHTSPAAPSVFAAFAQQLEREASALGARFHWGKQNWATHDDVVAGFGRDALDAFNAVREAVDPHGRCLDAYLRQRLLPAARE